VCILCPFKPLAPISLFPSKANPRSREAHDFPSKLAKILGFFPVAREEEERREDDFDVATGMNYGVASCTSWSNVILKQ
jgi:hypothetical protein